MRRIRQIEALDILIAWNKTGFYKIDLCYGLSPPKREWPGEDGYPLNYTSPVFETSFTREDFTNPEYDSSKDVLTISTIQSRD